MDLDLDFDLAGFGLILVGFGSILVWILVPCSAHSSRSSLGARFGLPCHRKPSDEKPSGNTQGNLLEVSEQSV